MPGSFFKQPWEQFTIGMDFTNAAATGAAVVSGTCAVVDKADQSNLSSTMLVGGGSTYGDATVAGQILKVTLKGGTAAHVYDLRFRATMNNGDLLEEDADLSVQDEGT